MPIKRRKFFIIKIKEAFAFLNYFGVNKVFYFFFSRATIVVTTKTNKAKKVKYFLISLFKILKKISHTKITANIII